MPKNLVKVVRSNGAWSVTRCKQPVRIALRMAWWHLMWVIHKALRRPAMRVKIKVLDHGNGAHLASRNGVDHRPKP